jgi:anti-sigma B factor antagonist
MPTTADMYGSMTVLAVGPVLAGGESEAFRERASAQLDVGGRWFVIDFSKVAYCDSRGLEELLDFQERVEVAGGVVKIAGLRGNCRRIFELVRFDKRFEVFDSLQEAVKSLD